VNRIVPLAALLIAVGLASARADEGAYGSLMGMARSASQDRGPDADDGSAPARDDAMRDALKDAVAQTPAPRDAARARSVPAAETEQGRAPVSVPAAPAPRLWTRLYSTLIPSWRRTASFKSEFDATSSSAAATAALPPALPAPLTDAAAVKAGERRGLAELMSTSVAPAEPQ
jgi:hypothetical protein